MNEEEVKGLTVSWPNESNSRFGGTVDLFNGGFLWKRTDSESRYIL